MGGGRDVMNWDAWPAVPKAPDDSQIPTSPFCDETLADVDEVASKNMPSGFKSPTKRDDRWLRSFFGRACRTGWFIDAFWPT